MIFRQITHDDLGCASYLVGDERAGVAAVVDPKLKIDEYLSLARYMGVRIEHILESSPPARSQAEWATRGRAVCAGVMPPRSPQRPCQGSWPVRRWATPRAGGGFLVVPTLAIALAMSMRLAVGTSLAIITATTVIALVAHLVAGRGVDLGLTGAMTAACIVGAVAGTAVSARLPQRLLTHAFAVLVVAVASYLLVSAAFLGGPPGA
jgi:hypothetical protein